VRQFIATYPGRALSAVSIFALVLPFLTLSLASRATAQVETKEPWAVVQFADLSPVKGEGLGQMAAEAMATELAKLDKYDVQPVDSVDRAMTELGYQPPVSRPEEIVRLGQNLRVVNVVAGELVNYRIVKDGAGRFGEVKLRVVVRDVASGLSINGAAVLGASGVRTGDVEDSTLIRDAINAAAFKASADIAKNTLPKATVLNTLERTALINKGSRSGFQQGQNIIVLRGREQVASAVVGNVEPDSAFVRVTRQTKGIQPGDKVQVIFDVPTLKAEFGKPGDLGRVSQRRSGNASGVISVLLVLGIAVFLLGQGRGGNTSIVTSLSSEATVLPNDLPAVQLSWRPDAFVKGNQTRFNWQIWRDDVPDTPVAVATGTASNYVDDGNALGNLTYYSFTDIGPGATCPALPGGDSVARTAIAAGRPYAYSIELVYRVSALESPDFGGGTSGGTTGGGTTGGGTTGGGTTGGGTTGGGTTGGGTTGGGTTGGGTTGGGTTGGGTTGGTTGGTGGWCYYVSTRTAAVGTATPLLRPVLRSPENDVTVATPTVFRFDSVRGSVTSILLEYVLQFSPNPQFPANQTATVNKWVDSAGTGTVSSPGAVRESTTVFPSSRTIYWRIGARNLNDKPGPVSINGERYIFSAPLRFQRPANPPAP